MRYPEPFDVIVVGGGHAGTEACLAAARMGLNTLLLTHNVETVGQMSCNPAIGGIGKGHLVREIDALGGAMACAADRAGIQFRTLNARKGPAVRATRAQADRVLYKAAVRNVIESQPNLKLFQQPVIDLIVEDGRVAGAITQTGIEFRAPAVVLTTGTFLGGRIHVGLASHEGGRAGDPPANALARRARYESVRNESLDQLLVGIDRATHLVQQLLTLARVDATSLAEEPRPIDPGSHLVEVLTSLAPLTKARHIEIRCVDECHARVQFAPEAMDILLRNLVDNALRYTPQSGLVEVRLEDADGGTRLVVADSGPGIPESQCEQVFERFYRGSHGDARGCGLGLSIVQRIAELHGAELTLGRSRWGGWR